VSKLDYQGNLKEQFFVKTNNSNNEISHKEAQNLTENDMVPQYFLMILL
jgi:hypothetical protein